MNLIQELKWRDLLYDMTDPALEEVMEKEKLTFYVGVDPTADSLAVHHLISYLVSKRLQDKGHHPILVIGGGTGLIGDPSGRSTERSLLTLEETMKNSEKIVSQIMNVIPDAKVVNNYDWIKEFDLIRFLRDIGKHFNINHMIAKDSVKSRLEHGISFTEFSYQIIQSLDFLELYKNHNCKLQIGGQDQWGNVTAGLDLIRKVEGHDAKAYCFTWPLLTKADGSKFGKTAGGAIWLDKEKTSVYEFYQYWINTPDKDAVSFLKKFTFMSVEETKKVIEEFEAAPHKRLAQAKIAEELTVLVHGRDAYERAVRTSKALFSGEFTELTSEEIKIVTKGLVVHKFFPKMPLVDMLIEIKLASSKREAREFIKNNAISLNAKKVTDIDYLVDVDDCAADNIIFIKRGKKKYAVVQLHYPVQK